MCIQVTEEEKQNNNKKKKNWWEELIDYKGHATVCSWIAQRNAFLLVCARSGVEIYTDAHISTVLCSSFINANKFHEIDSRII